MTVIFFMLLAWIAFCPDIVWAYIDPGTGSVVFSSLGYIIGMAAVVFGFLIRPIKNIYFSIREKFKCGKETDKTI